MNFVISEYTNYSESEILPLYESVSWTAYTRNPEQLRNAYRNSLLTLAAHCSGELIGVVRAVGDGCTVVFIQDLLVSPAHRRKGVGSALLAAVRSRFSSVRQIQLTCDNSPDLIAFYAAQGLRPLASIGMTGFMA